jgi:ubiquitin-protein ligase E3 C
MPFIGRLYYDEQGLLVEPQFAGVFLNILLGRMNQIDDLWHLDKDLYNSLMSIKRLALEYNQQLKSSSHNDQNSYDHNDPIANLGLYFEVDRNILDQHIFEELLPNGSNTLVTKDNFHSYIYRYANYKLNVETKSQCQAFLTGMIMIFSLIPYSFLT